MNENDTNKEELQKRKEEEEYLYQIRELDRNKEMLNIDIDFMVSQIRYSCEKIRTYTDNLIESDFNSSGCSWTGLEAIETNNKIKYYLDTVEEVVKMIYRYMREIDYEFDTSRSEIFKKIN